MGFIFDQDFLDHTKRHVRNVKEISITMMKYLSENKEVWNEFGIESEESLNKFKFKLIPTIEKHDIAKTNDSKDFLKKYNLDEPIYKTLFKLSGVKIENNTPERDFIDKLNRIDKKEIEQMFKNLNFNAFEKRLFLKIEMISDLVERGCNPLSEIEFGKKVEKGSKYAFWLTKEESLMTSYLEGWYDSSIKPRQEIFAAEIRNKEAEVQENNLQKKNDISKPKIIR